MVLIQLSYSNLNQLSKLMEFDDIIILKTMKHKNWYEAEIFYVGAAFDPDFGYSIEIRINCQISQIS